MSDITILNVAHHKRETDFFRADYPEGFGEHIYLFVHFISPAVVVLDGAEHLTESDACIIYTPGQKQEYRHHNGVFVNDFIIYKVDDPHFSARYGLPENELFYVSNGDEITRRLEIITYTITDRLVDRSEETKKHVRELFETLSSLHVENNPGSKRIFEVKQRFILLRDELRKNPVGWTVDKMAKHVWFTRSRFSVLYKEFFKISPNADFVNIKTEHAKKLLKTTDMSVADISVACGYSSVEHFIRMFHKRVKQTPLQYRKKADD